MSNLEADYVLALDALTAPPGSPSLQAAGPDVQATALQAKTWIAGPNVVGTGVTYKTTAGKRAQNQWSLRVYVKTKEPEAQIPKNQVVPKTVELPGVAEEIVTDVFPIGLLALQANTTRVRPLAPGISLSLSDGETGTLGCFVAKKSNPQIPLLLSNSHVLAKSGLAAPRSTVVQPSREDGGKAADMVGQLEDVIPFDFTAGFNNLCDAATASITPGTIANAEIPLIGKPIYSEQYKVAVGTQVQKSGRTSEHTVGTVQDTHFRTYMLYPDANGGYSSAGYREQVLCTKYTEKGDSGALVCTTDGKAVGLHWAGSQASSIFSPIQFVFQQLNIQLWTN